MSFMSEVKKLIKGIKVNLSEDEFEFLSNLAKAKGDIPIARIARSIILDYMNGTKTELNVTHRIDSPKVGLPELIDRICKLEKDNLELLAWKKEVESSINANPPSLNDEDLDIDWDEINANNIRNQEIIKKLEQRLKPQQNEEVYVPGSLDKDKNTKDSI